MSVDFDLAEFFPFSGKIVLSVRNNQTKFFLLDNDSVRALS